MLVLDEVLTFSEATEELGKGVSYLTDMVKAGWLIEGIHFRRAGRVKLITREAVNKIKENELKAESIYLKYFCAEGEKLGAAIISNDKIQSGRHWMYATNFADDSKFEYHRDLLIQYANDYNIDFPIDNLNKYEGNKTEAIMAYCTGISKMFNE